MDMDLKRIFLEIRVHPCIELFYLGSSKFLPIS
jgi:hypothetical protein